jgi:hypothetical protein
MSEPEKPNESQPLSAVVGPPSLDSAIIPKQRETLIAITLSALLLVDLGLIYVLYDRLSYALDTPASVGIAVGVLIVISIISLTVIRVAVSRYKSPVRTIPPEDRALLEELIRSENTKAVELYVRLSSLGGPTGTATKLGLTGLPLATIALTIFFAIIALFSAPFLDLAKLTLGAFIGSFVQRSGEALERAVRATTPSTTLTRSSPQPSAPALHSEDEQASSAVHNS